MPRDDDRAIERARRMAETGLYEPPDFTEVDAMLREAGRREGLTDAEIDAKLGIPPTESPANPENPVNPV
jgi:hypothetical protein